MSNPTSSFGWQMPTSSDLVTDLPADFEVFGQAVDTTLADLKGGTTGQVLKKNSNTDMDFVWSADTGFTNPMTTTGDTIYSSSGSTPARLGIGTTGQVLTVSGGLPAWSTPAGGGKILQVVQATTTTTASSTSTSAYVDTNLTASITPSSSSSKVLVLVTQSIEGYRAGNDVTAYLNLVRGSTVIFNTGDIGTIYMGQGSGTETIWGGNQPITYLDSPATTASTTYKTRMKIGGGTVYSQFNNNISSIILMEVGA